MTQRGVWSPMRDVARRCSHRVLVHPVAWGAGVGVVLVVLGVAIGLPPLVVGAAGAVIALLHILHARRRGYCPIRTPDVGRSIGEGGEP